jgi:hypothetical protein
VVAALVTQAFDLGVELTLYERIGAPPSFWGGDHRTTTRPDLSVAVTLRGALAITYGERDEELLKNSKIVPLASE